MTAVQPNKIINYPRQHDNFITAHMSVSYESTWDPKTCALLSGNITI